MASSPMCKLRKTGAVDQDGNVVAIPRLPSVAGSNKPPGWNRWSPAEKAEHLLGLASTGCTTTFPGRPTISIPTGLQRRRRSSAWWRWSPPKSGGEAAREHHRQRILSEMTRREFGDEA
jgi:hypothetical protein